MRAGRSVGAAITDRLQQGPDGDRRREHRHVPGRVHPVHPRHRGRARASRSCSASASSCRCSPRCSRRRRSCTRCAARALLRSSEARSAPASSASSSSFDFMGKSKWFFSMSGVILLIGALAIAGKGINFGIDFESRHADHRARCSSRRPSTRCATCSRRRASATRRSRRSHNPELGKQRRPDLDGDARAAAGRRGQRVAARGASAPLRQPERRVDRPELRPDRRELARSIAIIASLHRDHDLHRAALRVEVRRAGADRADARHPDRGGRLRPHRPGGDDVDGRGAAHHPGLLALRHDHRVRPRAREHPAHAERGVLADRPTARCPRSRRARWPRASARCCRCSRCASSAARRCRTSRSR